MLIFSGHPLLRQVALRPAPRGLPRDRRGYATPMDPDRAKALRERRIEQPISFDLPDDAQVQDDAELPEETCDREPGVLPPERRRDETEDPER